MEKEQMEEKIQKMKIACEKANIHFSKIKRGEKDIVIFDIDGTLVDDESICIIPVIELYRYLRSLGYPIYIITARLNTPYNYKFTVNMLLMCGIKDYMGIFMRPPGDIDLYAYKEKRRKYLVNRGYNIVASVGDMPFDFGKYSGMNIQV